MRAGQRTHGTTFRPLKLTSQVSTPGGGVCRLWLPCCPSVSGWSQVRRCRTRCQFARVPPSQRRYRFDARPTSTTPSRRPAVATRDPPCYSQLASQPLSAPRKPGEHPYTHASVNEKYRQRAVKAHGRECNRSSNSRVPAGGRYQGPRRATLTHRPSIQHQANRLAGKNVSDVTYFVSSAWNLEPCSIHPQAQYQSSSPPLEPRTRSRTVWEHLPHGATTRWALSTDSRRDYAR